MAQKVYLNILKFGIYFSLISVFLVFKDFLFPFITSKQIFFNIVIEILLIFWLAFIVKYPEYRPKKSWISIGLLGFFTALILSCFSSVDFNLSFWGDVERMLGVFHLLHFLAFYFIIITVFREWRDWKVLFIASIFFAFVVALKGITGVAYSTIGNTAYVAGYMIFSIYFCLLLFFKEENKTLRWLYLVPLPVFIMQFKTADSSGGYVGLGSSIIALFFLYGVLSKNKKLKIATVSLFVLSVLLTGLLLANKNSDFVRGNNVLNFASEISLQKNTFQTRLISWNTALQDFKNHPILGTGHGNFAITFDKYFDPKFYNYTRSETYFDRAHNNLIDIVSTTGLVGLLTYLSIFLAAAVYLIKGYRKEKINLHEFILISCLIIGYFVQNLAVFDSLVTYISLMTVLAFVYRLNRKSEEDELEEVGSGRGVSYLTKDKKLENKEIYALAGAGIILLTILYQYNYKPIKMLTGTIDGQMAFNQGQIGETIEIYKKALSYNTVLDRDSRTSLIRLFYGDTTSLKSMSKEERNETLDYLIDLADKNVAYNPGDSLNQMLLSQMLNTASIYNSDNAEKFTYYSNRALEAVDKSIEASPRRVPIYYQKAQIYLTRGENDKAIETLKYALSLNEEYFDSHCHLGKILISSKKEEEGYVYLDQCIDLGGAGSDLLYPADFVKYIINHYVGQEDWSRLIKLYTRLTVLEPNNFENWVKLAKLYAQTGDRENAEEAVNKAIELNRGLEQYADDFLNSL